MDRNQRKELDKRLNNLIENSMTIEDVKKRVNEGICRCGGISAELLVNELTETAKEMINHPSHYNMGKYECLDVVKELIKDMKGIEATLFFNAFKYLWRYKQKNGLQDLKKCEFYLKELIKLNKIT